MKFKKKDIGKLCIVAWYDACTHTRVKLDQALTEGLSVNKSVGWLGFYNGKMIAILHEISGVDDIESKKEYDITVIPRGWVKSFKFILHRKSQ